MNQTIDYYNHHAQQYIERTQTFDVSHIFNDFASRLPKGAKVLDLGCGSGRDSIAFQQLGFEVLAIDAAEEFIKHVRTLGLKAKQMWMEELDFHNEFDGIWCCASLLHVNKEHLPNVLSRINQALKKGGLAFLSFKVGSGEGEEDGRYFHYLDEDSLLPYLDKFEIKSCEKRISKTNQNPTTWLSVIVEKKGL